MPGTRLRAAGIMPLEGLSMPLNVKMGDRWPIDTSEPVAQVPRGVAEECPICGAAKTHLEGHLIDGGQYCNACENVFIVDTQGALVHWWATQNNPRR